MTLPDWYVIQSLCSTIVIAAAFITYSHYQFKARPLISQGISGNLGAILGLASPLAWIPGIVLVLVPTIIWFNIKFNAEYELKKDDVYLYIDRSGMHRRIVKCEISIANEMGVVGIDMKLSNSKEVVGYLVRPYDILRITEERYIELSLTDQLHQVFPGHPDDLECPMSIPEIEWPRA